MVLNFIIEVSIKIPVALSVARRVLKGPYEHVIKVKLGQLWIVFLLNDNEKVALAVLFRTLIEILYVYWTRFFPTKNETVRSLKALRSLVKHRSREDGASPSVGILGRPILVEVQCLWSILLKDIFFSIELAVIFI